MKRSLFILGFAIGLSIFVGLNVYSYHIAEPPCCDGIAYFGFPFQYGTFGGFVGYTGFKIESLLLNYLVGLVGSAVFALFFKRLVPPSISVIDEHFLPPVLASVRHVVAWHGSTRLT